ncbi:17282_t:CDS:2 [Dentiscutata heterogama]|uniref:17282_t:CDS:1 n=1 Tax=Dentiscutata heterogama TaxID=1316150 RepID=A0ACA9K9T0_9GLOM|nr:17282_t:CDS:2 [Dentiscutata heterogama]
MSIDTLQIMKRDKQLKKVPKTQSREESLIESPVDETSIYINRKRRRINELYIIH